MTDFKARTRAQLQGIPDELPPGESAPTADIECLRELGATENWPRTLEYSHPKHSLEDFQRPGYISGDVRENLHVGDLIHYCLYGGSRLPSDWSHGICTVLEIPSHRKDPLILAGLIEYPPATPWRGDKKDTKAA